MLILGRILAACSLVCALAAAVTAVWFGDAWHIGIGILGLFSSATCNVVVWRARRQGMRPGDYAGTRMSRPGPCALSGEGVPE
ncbi:hypothetical protein [Streptomyces sp. WAC 06783]|uniref:hypothetical protein n=1 Tax=Streptomyces sp. WAC 06783 TaxID=2203211 RepID=UPI000F735FAD|nr:hypothetical protein [Streptomyces sp. WAC 06783]